MGISTQRNMLVSSIKEFVQNGSGEQTQSSTDGFQGLAEAVKMSDEILALLHSILVRGKLEQQRPTWYWQALWWASLPFIAIPAVFFWVVLVCYQRWMPYDEDLGNRVDGYMEEGLMRPFSKREHSIREWMARRFDPVSYFPRWLLGPKSLNTFLGWVIHPVVRDVREGVVTSGALDCLYHSNQYFPWDLGQLFLATRVRAWKWPWWLIVLLYYPIVLWWFFLTTLLTWFVCNLSGPQAVRNRLKALYPEMLCAMEQAYHSFGKDFKMLELACGSADAAITALAQFKEMCPEANPTLTLVDVNKDSLKRARLQAIKLGVLDQLVFSGEGRLDRFLKGQAPGSFHMIGIVGFFDYRTEQSIERLSGMIKSTLCPGGWFFGAHISNGGPSWNSSVTEYLIGWPLLVRRTMEEYKVILVRAGWAENEIRKLFMEEHGIHTISVFQKTVLM